MLKWYLIFLLQTLLLLLTQAQILSIDYGTQFIKASLVHAGAGKSFSIVENPKSQRKFINSLGLYNQERFYEADNLPKRSRGPSNCFIYSHLLVDLHKNPSMIEQVKKDLILEYVKDSSKDQLLAEFVLAGFPEGENTVSLLQTVAMMLKYIKQQAQKSAKSVLKDTILIVPNHWTIHQRRFLIKAAELADLYVLSLIHENTAASINYALSQRSTNQTQNVLFYNLGANSFQMTLVQFKAIKVQKSPKPVQSIFVLGDYGKAYVGGLKFDGMIAKFFTNKFQKKYNKTLSQRGQIRLLSESERMKLVLSANKQATIFVEGIMDGIDFSAVITRKQFEELAEETIQQLISPVKRFLFDHDLKTEDLHGIELIGGSTRIPRLQTLLGEIVGNKSLVGAHINGDEAMVLGAAFYGANSSKKFKVKGINLYDGFNFQMRLVLRNAEEGIEQDDNRYYFKNVTLFKKKSRFGLTKEVSFKCKQNLIVQIYKEDDGNLELVTSHQINSIKDINQTNYKVSLTFEISPVSVVILNDVKYLYSKQVVQSYTEKVRKVVKSNQTEKKEVDEQEESGEEDKKKEEDSEEQEEKSGEKDQTEADSQGQKQKENKTKSQKKKKRKAKIEYETVQKFRNITKNLQKQLAFVEVFKVLKQQDPATIQQSKKHFGKYEAKQQFKRRLAESKNKLQALIYQVRDKIQHQQFTQFAQQKQLSLLDKLVKEKSEWYDDTVSNEYQDYKKQHKQLNDPIEKIKKRMVEHRERDQVKKRAFQILSEYKNLSSKIQKGKTWITDEEVSQLNQNITQAKQKIQRLHQKLANVPLNQDSAFRNKDLIKETDIIKDQYFLLKAKPKPKVQKKEEKEQKEEEKEQQESGEEDNQGESEKQSEVNEDEL